MNYLGHAFLSFYNGDILTGNMIADHVKGKVALEQFPTGIRRGIELHRQIDGNTDLHPATARAKLLFREHYGLYSGPIVDTLYDHFLANDPKFFPDENSLLKFTQTVYEQLDVNAAWLPEKFAAYFPSMKQYNWLYNYRTVKGIERALNGLGRRAMYMAPVDKAYEIFIASYYQLNQCYYEFIDDVISFVKTETASHNS